MAPLSKHDFGAFFFAGLYAVLVLMPVLVLATGVGARGGSGWWFDFSMGLGFGALALMGGQFVLTARFRRATAPFGIDVVYVFHRWLAVIGLALVVAHYLVLRARYPATLGSASPLEAPFHMTAGRLALLVFAVLIGSSLWRKRIGIEYDRWRVAHAVLALSGVALSIVHVRGVAYYSGMFFNRTVLNLFFISLVGVVLYVRLVKPLLVASRPYRVDQVRPEPGDAWVLTLRPDGHEGFRFEPGQFGWLSLGVAPWRAKEHPFSLSGSAERHDELEVTIKELGDFTRTVGRTEPGAVAYLDGPHGAFTVDRYPDAPGFFFLAGGVGIAPILSMLRTLADRGDERRHWLVYGNRSWDTIIHRAELERLEQRLDLTVTHVLLEPPPGWEGPVGMPDPRLLRAVLADAPRAIHCYLCGPEAMSKMAQRTLHDIGISWRRIHFELFDMA
jgi:predicted ferric reductase